LGTYGGFVVANEEVTDLIRKNSGAFKDSTALPPMICAASRESIRLIQEDQKRTVLALQENIDCINKQLVDLGSPQYSGNCVPIFYLRNSPTVAKLRTELPSHGIFAPTVTNYFAEYCEIGLRWTIQAGHTEEQLNRLMHHIRLHLAAPV
ncbi:MAG: aminotransferase class I/II-fold pyridoxal phosphate-dependent enzyme, partial [Terriglobales bacterium]